MNVARRIPIRVFICAATLLAALVFVVTTVISYKHNVAGLNERLMSAGMRKVEMSVSNFSERYEKLAVVVKNVADVLEDQYDRGYWTNAVNALPLLRGCAEANATIGFTKIMLGVEADKSMSMSTGWILPMGMNLSRSVWYKLGIKSQGIEFSDMYPDPATERMSYAVVKRMHNDYGRIIGVVALSVTSNTIDISLEESRLWNEGFVFLISRSGAIISSPSNKSFVGENIALKSNVITDSLAAAGAAILKSDVGVVNCEFEGQPWRIFFKVEHHTDSTVALAYPVSVIEGMAIKYAIGQAATNAIAALLFTVLFFPMLFSMRTIMKNLAAAADNLRIALIDKSPGTDGASRELAKFADEIKSIEKSGIDKAEIVAGVSKILRLIQRQQEILTRAEKEEIARYTLLETVGVKLEKKEAMWRAALGLSGYFSRFTNFDEIAMGACERLMSVVGCYGVTLGTVDAVDSSQLRTRATAGYGSLTSERAPQSILIQHSCAGRAFLTREVQWVEDVNELWDCIPVSPAVITQVLFPLVHNGECVGVLEIAYDRLYKHDDELISMLEPVALGLAGFLSICGRQRDVRESYSHLARNLQAISPSFALETEGHLARVAEFSLAAAKWLGRSGEEQEEIAIFSRLHDIGKVKTPISILAKPGPLTSEEMHIVMKHPDGGVEFLGDANWLAVARNLCRTHHEKWDGSGYPRGLSGDEIPWEGQVVALADVYDLLRSSRPYKSSLSHDAAYRIITEGDGRVMPSHFSPIVMEFFRECHGVYAKLYESLLEEYGE